MQQLPRKTSETIWRELGARKVEQIELLKRIEHAIIETRGYVYQLPEPGTPVVVGLSGGADTTVTTAILLEEFGLEIYPFFMQRNQRSQRFEEASVDFFVRLFQDRYPGKMHDVVKLAVPNPATEIKPLLTDELRLGTGHPMRNSIMMEYGVQYAFGLGSQGKHVRNVFCSTIASDADCTYHSTLTALRSLMFHVMADMGDPTWQLTSIAIEKELGLYLDKDVLIRWAATHDVPLEKTRTCIKDTEHHCGTCHPCYDRKRLFIDAGVADATVYENHLSPSELHKEFHYGE